MDNAQDILLKARGLHFTYHDGTTALAGIDLDVYRGETLAVIGPNGAGKSTLMLHLNGLFMSDGKVEVEGIPITEKNIHEVRRKVGVVFQDPEDALFSPTVYEDVAFGPLYLGDGRKTLDEKVRAALVQVGLVGYEKRSSFHISFGEKKRVSIAAILACEPQILVLDEPTSNLDPANRRRIINIVKSFGKTVVIASHDLDFVLAVADRCIILNKGKVVCTGAPGDILADEKLLAANQLEVPLSILLRKRGEMR